MLRERERVDRRCAHAHTFHSEEGLEKNRSRPGAIVIDP